ncbi:MAG: hypothetical protein HN757_14735 [Calditrichaeota bacterium]|jgi:hypothetical protein|nr:hypothetical protein [Calditrichota bacterium]
MELESSSDNRVEQLLGQELNCFNRIMSETNKFLDESSTFSVDAFMKLLDERECWIKLIEQAEDEWKLLTTSNNGERESLLRKEIAAISRTLIMIDAKILDVLQSKKLQTIKELTKLVDKQSIGGEIWSSRLGKAKLLDLRLE